MHTGIIGLAADKVVPGLAVAIKGAVSMPLDPEPLAAEDHGGCLVLVCGRRVRLLVDTGADGQGVGEPVLDVLAPLLQSARKM